MKIAQVAPLWERVPPPTYEGIELVCQSYAEMAAMIPLALKLKR